MTTVALCNVDHTKFPNLALMKLSAWHKKHGHNVEKYIPLFRHKYDKIYASKVFTFSNDTQYLPRSAHRGGTGFNNTISLPDEVEHICPDYGFFNTTYALGFTTRGCPNNCDWCIVPKKEGKIRAHAEIDEFVLPEHDAIVLMDNNILAHDHGIHQLEEIANRGLKLDCNQGIDARRVDGAIARLLARIKWTRFIRFACDREDQMPHVERAVRLYRAAANKKGQIFSYVLVKDVPDALRRVMFLRDLGVDCFAQPYRDLSGDAEPTQEQRDFARWVNHKAVFKSVPWEKYRRP